MNYREMLKWAKEKFGVKGQPKKADLERMIAEAEASETIRPAKPAEVYYALPQDWMNHNTPDHLRACAGALRDFISELDAEARQAEERARAIETAQAGMVRAGGALHLALAGYRDAVAEMVNLGLEFVWPEPLTPEVVDAIIVTLTPPVPPIRIYVFWATGSYPIGRGYIAAENFEVACKRYCLGEADFGVPWTSINPCSDGREAAIRAINTLVEGGTSEAADYSTVFYAKTFGGHLYEVKLDGPEYSGRAVVNATTFAEAKVNALAGDVIEGDKPDPEIIAELQKAMERLEENGRVEHEGHTLMAKTIF